MFNVINLFIIKCLLQYDQIWLCYAQIKYFKLLTISICHPSDIIIISPSMITLSGVVDDGIIFKSNVYKLYNCLFYI